MNSIYFHLLFNLLSVSVLAQNISKPIGCFAGTNGTNPLVLLHEATRGVLISEKWSDIEQLPGVYDFTALNNKIDVVKEAGLKYALAIPAGAFGSPDWLIDSLNVSFHSFEYQNQNWRLPLWWEDVCIQKLADLIAQLGNLYASDSMLSHIYISQMSVNGVEGHLNGVNMGDFTADGFTNQKWISAAKTTAYNFANAFSDNPIVFEVHEIGNDTLIPATIINDLYNDPNLCERIGLGMWWISGKTSYQTDLIDFIYNFQGDKYAQVIGRSDQPERFEDSLYANVFIQAKQLNIRYIEPWPYEFQFHTNDSLLQDFNMWADANFTNSNTCSFTTATNNIAITNSQTIIYPNPTSSLLTVQTNFPFQNLKTSIYNLNGQCLIRVSDKRTLDISHLPKGIYYAVFTIDEKRIIKKITKTE